MQKKDVRLSDAQHNLIVQMRNGAKIWRGNISRRYMTDTMTGTKTVHSTVVALQRLGLIGYIDDKLTDLGRTINID